MSAGYTPGVITSGHYEPTVTNIYITSLIPPITQNFARNPILKSNIGATSGLFRDMYT